MTRTSTATRTRGALRALPALLICCSLFAAAQVSDAAPYPTTINDFRLPGTQPLTITDNFLAPSNCSPCHANYGSPTIEPFRGWQASMMAQSGRDPLMLAALAVANQDLAHAGETCLRCHLPKGWLEGRSVPEDGSAITTDDRHGIQCHVCHRMVDPFPAAENPPEDGAILAALAAPVPALGSAMMVIDPLDRRRGPFTLGSDPHVPASTLVSPFHRSSDMCGVCHNVRNPAFTRNMLGEYELNALDTPGDPTLGFPEQSTYDEWAASEYAASGVYAPQFGRNREIVASCQDCHMPAVTGRGANTGPVRDDIPLHDIVGGNTFIPDVLPHHPAFGGEVDAALLQETVAKATTLLRKAATLSLTLAGGNLTVRVTNDSGHKLPTGYPDGRRMWLHVRAFDADRAVVFESGRYVFATADLLGYEAEPMDADYDPYLRVWETIHGMSPTVAALFGQPPGPSLHLVLNNVREKDNRIPPRGFTNAAFDTFDGEPVGATYADGQYWDEAVYPVGSSAVQAEVILYYQTASREYVEFLRDENVTTAAGNVLFDLWDQHNKSEPVEMAHAFVESDAKAVSRCHKTLARLHQRLRTKYLKEWAKCYETEASGLTCNAIGRDARIATAETKLREKIGGLKDRRCAGSNLTPITLGHGATCPVPCADDLVFDMNDLASCAVCMVEALGAETLDAAYGVRPPAVPATLPVAAQSCQRAVAKAATGLANGWTRALTKCEEANQTGANDPAVDCSTDPDGAISKAADKAEARIATCDDLSVLGGCATSGTVAATRACMEAAIGDVAPAFTGVAYP